MEPEERVVLSLGGGVNSIALLTRWLREDRWLDLVIFADTGEEQPETIAAVNHAFALAKKHNIETMTVKAHDGKPLVDWYRDQKSIPFIRFRSCTDHFKIRPIRKALRDKGWKKVVMLVGIAYDEVHRVRNSDVKWIRNEFPLCDWKMTRQDCEDELAAAWDGPKVVKSGCIGCPQGGKRLYTALLKTDPAQFERWNDLEKNGRNYPKDTLLPNGPSLEKLKSNIQGQTTLPNDDTRGDACGGGCFT